MATCYEEISVEISNPVISVTVNQPSIDVDVGSIIRIGGSTFGGVIIGGNSSSTGKTLVDGGDSASTGKTILDCGDSIKYNITI